VNPPHVAFVLEQTLGHITHTDNLRRLVPLSDDIDATFVPIEYELEGRARHIPGYGNWTVRAGLRARRAVRKVRAQRPLDAMFVHTQVPAILIPDIVKRVPTIVSLDATPRQYDELGDHYGHATSGARIEGLKWRANRACFERAAHIVTWAAWTRQGLIDEYGVAASKITVVPPGVDVSRWKRVDARPDDADSGPIRILFVGGDLARKGGLLLLDAFRTLRDDPSLPELELHLVTKTPVAAEKGLVVHSTMTPNSAELVDLFHRSHIFCLPTLGDCLPMVLSEAGATGLPLVSTDVGAISEIVRDGETGLLVPTNDVAALHSTLTALACDRDLRRRLGDRAIEVVAESFDAEHNAMRLAKLLRDIAAPATADER
jgi:glycosyltransferase involved in cell wall biosynthesis